MPPQAATWGEGDSSPSFADLDGAPFPAFQPGSVWLVGAGPGAPGLLTLLAYHALTQADTVVYDALVNTDVLGYARADARRIHAGKRGGKPSAQQADICATLVAEAEAGRRVLRLKGGDPFLFGRGGEECEALRAAGVPFRVVPGISSGLGGLAYAGLAATHRTVNQSVTFLTGHDLTGALPTAIDWAGLARAAPVLVMYMAVKHLPAIATRLIEAGRAADEPVAIVARATLPDQTMTCTTLADTAEPHDWPTPAIVVVGGVVPLADALAWFDAPASAGLMG